ncbi:MAG TPA: hypothetical protein VGO11_12890 [Chthoniobacteraceae bacterium]|nr:hypothetical protein [Chthoniobacteraceae bacterium]
MPDNTPSLSQLQRALQIAEEIQRLEEELQSVLGGRSVAAAPKAKSVTPAAAPAKPGKRGGRRTFTAETRAKMAAAQQARWAVKKGPSAGAATAVAVKKSAGPVSGQKRQVSPEVRARLAAAMKARWAAAKKKGVPGPNARR